MLLLTAPFLMLGALGKFGENKKNCIQYPVTSNFLITTVKIFMIWLLITLPIFPHMPTLQTSWLHAILPTWLVLSCLPQTIAASTWNPYGSSLRLIKLLLTFPDKNKYVSCENIFLCYLIVFLYLCIMANITLKSNYWIQLTEYMQRWESLCF